MQYGKELILKSDKEKNLLKPFGFTFFKAAKLMMFAFVFSSIGFSFAAYKANVAILDVTQQVSKRVAQDFLNLSRLYKQDKIYEQYLVKQKSAPFSIYYRRLGAYSPLYENRIGEANPKPDTRRVVLKTIYDILNKAKSNIF